MKVLVTSIWLLISLWGGVLEAQKIKSSWALIYYMPYDNNLSAFADTVQRMVQNAIANTDAVATMMIDDAGKEKIKFAVLGKKSFEQATNLENSASTETLSGYLDWVLDHVEAKHYALIFLDHGGGANELCLDENPSKGFLKVDQVGLSVRAFCEAIGKPLDLLFLQVCAKGAIEPLYELRRCATYTLASQPELGAPNYYYKNALAKLNRIKNGNELATEIAKSEPAHMFYSYTLVDNRSFDRFKKEFHDFLRAINNDQTLKIDVNEVRNVEYYHTSYWDLQSFLKSISIPESLEAERKSLMEMMKNDLIVWHYINPLDSRMEEYCGLSILAPVKRNYSEDNLRLTFLRDSPLLQIKLTR